MKKTFADYQNCVWRSSQFQFDNLHDMRVVHCRINTMIARVFNFIIRSLVYSMEWDERNQIEFLSSLSKLSHFFQWLLEVRKCYLFYDKFWN